MPVFQTVLTMTHMTANTVNHDSAYLYVELKCQKTVAVLILYNIFGIVYFIL